MGGPAHQVSLLSGRRMDPDRFETLLVHGRLAPGEQSLESVAEGEGARTRFLPELAQEDLDTSLPQGHQTQLHR